MAGPRDLTNEELHIIPTSRGGYEQSYNAQAAVESQNMLVVAARVSQAPNDKLEVTDMGLVAAPPPTLEQLSSLLADSGYFSTDSVKACETQFIEPMSSMKREAHQFVLLERFAADAMPPECDDGADCASRRRSRCSACSSA